jgi:hypothetical protein
MSTPADLSGTGTAGAQRPLFPRRTLIAGAAVSALSFASALLLAGFGERLGGPVTAGAGAYSVSALGHSALVAFLRQAGVSAVPRRHHVAVRPGPRSPLVLAEPASADGLASFFREADDGGASILLVLPKRQGIPDPARPRWISASATYPLGVVRSLLASALETALAGPEVGQLLRPGAGAAAHEDLEAAASPRLERVAGERLDALCDTPFGRTIRVAVDEPQLLGDVAGLAPLVECPGGTLVARVERGERPPLYVVADPDVLSNHGLGRAEHASLAEALFARELRADAAIFDETIHGLAVGPGLIEELLSFPLVIVTLHALLLAGLVVWSGSEQFGRPPRAPATLAAGKQALIECAAQLACARRLAAPAARRFAQARLRSLARGLGLTATLPPGPELARRIDEVLSARRLPPRALEHWSAIERAATAAGPGDESPALSATAALHDWMQEITHGIRRNP